MTMARCAVCGEEHTTMSMTLWQVTDPQTGKEQKFPACNRCTTELQQGMQSLDASLKEMGLRKKEGKPD